MKEKRKIVNSRIKGDRQRKKERREKRNMQTVEREKDEEDEEKQEGAFKEIEEQKYER